MRKQDKIKNIELVNQKLEESYLKSKGLIVEEAKLNEANRNTPQIYKMVNEALDSIREGQTQLHNVRGYINDNYDTTQIKKMESYQTLLDVTKKLSRIRDMLLNTRWPDEN